MAEHRQFIPQIFFYSIENFEFLWDNIFRRLYHAVASECAGHVEEHHVAFHVLSGNHSLGIVEGVHRIAFDDGVGVLFDPAEMVASESLEVGAAVDNIAVFIICNIFIRLMSKVPVLEKFSGI